MIPQGIEQRPGATRDQPVIPQGVLQQPDGCRHTVIPVAQQRTEPVVMSQRGRGQGQGRGYRGRRRWSRGYKINMQNVNFYM